MMKKTLLPFILLLLPFFTFAQNEPPVYKDFNKKVREITTSFKLNEHVWIMQTCIDTENFELAAVDDKMQVLWRTTLSGYPLDAGKFKGHILAISAAKYEWVMHNVINPYSAFLVDEQTGKLLLQKVIYDSKSETKEFPSIIFNDDGSNFTLVVRQSDQSTSVFGYPTKLNTIKDLTVIKLDDNLNPVVSKPKFPDEEFINVTCNNRGDLFLITHKEDKTIKVTRYEAPKYLPQDPIVADMDVHKESNLEDKRAKSQRRLPTGTACISLYFTKMLIRIMN